MDGMARGLETLQPGAFHHSSLGEFSEAITEYGLRGQWLDAISVLAVAREEGMCLDLQRLALFDSTRTTSGCTGR